MKRIAFTLFLQCIVASALFGQYLIVEGKVTDEQDSALPYAFVKLKGSQVSTVSNEEGRFTLKVPEHYCPINLTFSHVGFKDTTALLNCEKADIRITLREEVVQLDEIEITDLSAEEIILRCIKNIDKNYQTGTVNFTFFSREMGRLDNEPITLEESVYYVYYEERTKPDFSIRKIRAKSFTKYGRDRLADTRLTGIYATESHFLRRYTPNFLKKGRMKRYTYKLTDEIITNERSYFVIEISSEDEWQKGGVLHIDKEDYGISYMKRFSKDDEWGQGARLNAYQISFYKRENEKWFFTHGEKGQTSIDKKANKTIQVKRITVATNRTTQRAFSNEEKVPSLSMVKMLDQFTGKFDDEFWESYNVVPLEEDFKQALEQSK